jgi:hypothetical protein
VVPPDLVSYSINFFTKKQRMILKKKKMKGISKWNTALYSPNRGAATKKITFQNLGHYKNLLTKQNIQ